jgi:hypothetical protein
MLQRPLLHSSGHNFAQVNQQDIICKSSLRTVRRYHLKLLSCTFCTLNSSTQFIPLVSIFFVKFKDFEVFQVKLLQFWKTGTQRQEAFRDSMIWSILQCLCFTSMTIKWLHHNMLMEFESIWIFRIMCLYTTSGHLCSFISIWDTEEYTSL